MYFSIVYHAFDFARIFIVTSSRFLSFFSSYVRLVHLQIIENEPVHRQKRRIHSRVLETFDYVESNESGKPINDHALYSVIAQREIVPRVSCVYVYIYVKLNRFETFAHKRSRIRSGL